MCVYECVAYANVHFYFQFNKQYAVTKKIKWKSHTHSRQSMFMFIRYGLLFKIKFIFFETKWANNKQTQLNSTTKKQRNSICFMLMVHIIPLRIICHVDMFFFMILWLYHCSLCTCTFLWLSLYSRLSCLSCKFHFASLNIIFSPLIHSPKKNTAVIWSNFVVWFDERKIWCFRCVDIDFYSVKCVNELAEMIDFI